jgi:hypothetical protein
MAQVGAVTVPSHEFLEAQMTVFSLWVQRMRSTPYFLLSTVLVVLGRRVSDTTELGAASRQTRGRRKGSQKYVLARDRVVDVDGLVVTGRYEMLSRFVKIQ